MSIKSEIERQVRIKQRGVRLKKGDQFWRGLDLVVVLDVDPTKVKYRTVKNGDTSTIDRKSFLSRAVMRTPKPATDIGDYLKMVWAIAGTKSLPAEYRFKSAKRLLKSAPSEKEAQTVRNWLYALSMGKEPKK